MHLQQTQQQINSVIKSCAQYIYIISKQDKSMSDNNSHQNSQSQQEASKQQQVPKQQKQEGQKAEGPPVDYNKQQFQKQFEMHEQQQKLIRQQIEAESPLIGDIFPLTMLMDEFVQNEGFYIKVQHLLNFQIYARYRKTRRDGSCFYRALLYSLFEKIVLGKDEKVREHLVDRIKKSKEHLLAAKFEGVIFEDLQDSFLDKLGKPPKSQQELLKLFRDPEESNYLVLMLRFITSGELRNNAILYQTFIDGQIPIEMFCQIEVEPIDKEADQIQIMALLNYLNVAIKIVYLDANMNKEPYNVILPESAKPEDVVAELLYRPGHYDILYK